MNLDFNLYFNCFLFYQTSGEDLGRGSRPRQRRGEIHLSLRLGIGHLYQTSVSVKVYFLNKTIFKIRNINVYFIECNYSPSMLRTSVLQTFAFGVQQLYITCFEKYHFLYIVILNSHRKINFNINMNHINIMIYSNSISPFFIFLKNYFFNFY